jgi:hypothetical protein
MAYMLIMTNETRTTMINAHLKAHRAERLTEVVEHLQAAIKAGVVPNTLFTDAKETINRIVEEAAEAFLQSGPHVVGRNGEPHDQSDWWLDAYDADAFVHGAHAVPAVLKRAQKHDGLKEYSSFIANALLPLNELLATAKPLIRKRNELPKVRTEKQIADDAARMTCQCCGRAILAETGTIAHHGYERPGHGWQTGSCVGAKELPFEVSRDRLGTMITNWRERLVTMKKHLADVRADRVPLDVTVTNYNVAKHDPKRHVHIEVTRDNFDKHANDLRGYTNFERLKESHVAHQSRQIKNLSEAITEQQARYDNWKPTHRREKRKWVKL